LLRYVTETPELSDVVTPEASFNYLGQFDWPDRGDGLYRGMRTGLESSTAPEAIRPHVLDIVGRVERQCLELTWFYSEHRHRTSTITALAENLLGALRDIIRHCAEPDAGGRTPSDF